MSQIRFRGFSIAKKAGDAYRAFRGTDLEPGAGRRLKRRPLYRRERRGNRNKKKRKRTREKSEGKETWEEGGVR